MSLAFSWWHWQLIRKHRRITDSRGDGCAGFGRCGLQPCPALGPKSAHNRRVHRPVPAGRRVADRPDTRTGRDSSRQSAEIQPDRSHDGSPAQQRWNLFQAAGRAHPEPALQIWPAHPETEPRDATGKFRPAWHAPRRQQGRPSRPDDADHEKDASGSTRQMVAARRWNAAS